MKKVLVLTYDYAPYAVTGSIRVTQFLSYFNKNNIMPVVLTANHGKNNIDENLKKSIPQKIKIIKSKPVFKSFGTGEGQINNFYSKNAGLKVKVLRLLKDLFLSPDRQILWGLKVVLAGLGLIKRYKIKTIYVTAPPFSMFVTGYIISKLSGAKLILDYRDPWAYYVNQINQTLPRKILNRIYEKLATKHAYKIIVQNSEVKKYIQTDYEIKDKFLLIPNGFDPKEYNNIDEKKLDADFSFCYTGKFSVGNNQYDPTNLLIAFKKFIKKHNSLKIKFYIIGYIDKNTQEFIQSLSIQNNIILLGYLPRQKVFEYQKSADCLVHFLYPRQAFNCVSIKTYEYMVMKKPIISFDSPQTIQAKIFLNSKTGFVCDSHNLQQSINLFEKALSINLDEYIANRDENFVQQFNIQQLSQKICKLF